jgi:hypothetical protein
MVNLGNASEIPNYQFLFYKIAPMNGKTSLFHDLPEHQQRRKNSLQISLPFTRFQQPHSSVTRYYFEKSS